MPEMISVHQIVTREKKGSPRIVIKPNSRFKTEDFPMISEAEWKSMMGGEHPIIREPNDPTFVVPAQSGVQEPVMEGRSPRTDLASQAAAAAARETDDDDDGASAPSPVRRGRPPRRAADDEDDV